ncbi:PEPxxWA-CTERM sorting domain-containing protein [Rhodoblastus sp.]|uniref:PEPxxWA-CTERM sorting domain-containing protein n=1 Tax=Rhodoblastus sp. TaxID=1962975 RepID=UPI003F94E471
MKSIRLFSAFAFAAVTALGSAQAGVIPTTVTATGNYGGSLSAINDGYFPSDYTYWQTNSVYFGPGVSTGPTATFNMSFGGLYNVTGINAAVDNNDDYIFSFYNGANLVETYTYPASAGDVTASQGGQQNFSTITGYGGPPVFTAVDATNVIVTAANGDNLYAVGEAEFIGSAVPEPSTWALMLAGFGGLALAGRRKQKKPRFGRQDAVAA